MSLVEAAMRRREQEREDQMQTLAGHEVPTEEHRCPECGGPSRPGAKGPCRSCRPVAECLCGCGRPLWDRSTRGISRTCTYRVLAAFAAAPEKLRRQVLLHVPPEL